MYVFGSLTIVNQIGIIMQACPSCIINVYTYVYIMIIIIIMIIIMMI